jgi:thiol-disulfide isomerase/thioredoxin
MGGTTAVARRMILSPDLPHPHSDTFQEIALMRQWTLSLAVVALVAGTAFAGKYNTKLGIGDKAPAVAGIPAVQGSQETTINLDNIKEDVVVVVFLANHCPAVQASEDRLVDVAKSFQGKSVKFVGVCCSGDSGDAKNEDAIPAIKTKFKEGKYAGNTVYGVDPAGTIGKAFGATRTPEFFVLDKTRTVKYMGAMDDSPTNPDKVTKNYLKPAIEAVLGNETVEITETRPVGCGISYKR